MTDDELRAWAENVSGVNPIWKVPIAVLRLLDENAALRKQVEGHCERIAAQSALLSKRAEVAIVPGNFRQYVEEADRVFDGSTGMSSTIAGRKSSVAGA